MFAQCGFEFRKNQLGIIVGCRDRLAAQVKNAILQSHDCTQPMRAIIRYYDAQVSFYVRYRAYLKAAEFFPYAIESTFVRPSGDSLNSAELAEFSIALPVLDCDCFSKNSWIEP